MKIKNHIVRKFKQTQIWILILIILLKSQSEYQILNETQQNVT